MCAIAGVLDLPVTPQILEKMRKTMIHRGPDGAGELMTPRCALLHSRLAVIDPEGGAQPMTWDRGDEVFTITYNGELYNTQELRRELCALGHVFSTRSDTEVLLHAYAQWGKGCVDRLNGIYAFGVWHHRAGKLFLARDRMGVKPLFFTRHAGGVVFASEIKTILAYGVPARLDEYGAAQIMMFGPGRIPGSGVFHGIEEIEPGCCAYCENGNLRIMRYWKLRDALHTDTFDETLEKVRFLVTDAIRRQMVSDVPIGTFLSGGLDSSLITALCAGEMARQGSRLHTFSVDYADNDKYFVANKFQPNSDGFYIDLMQRQFQTKHHLTVLTPGQLFEGIRDAVIARDLPGMADVDISLLLFCRQIKPHVTVALSGECADEIFGGYPWYRDPEVLQQSGFPWAQNTAQRSALVSGAVKKLLRPADLVRQEYEKTCRESDVLPENASQRRMKEMVNLNMRWFMQTLLDRKDRMSMFSALEVRVPFCDHRIAEYLYTVPWEFKDHTGKEKGLLRKAMEGVLPQEVLWRKKSPYPKTWHPEYTQLVREGVLGMLEQKDAPIYAIADREQMRKLTCDSQWPWYGQLMRLPQTLCYLLQINTWLEEYKVQMLY